MANEKSCDEQYIQAAKAAKFDDDITRALIMKSMNPYEMKWFGSSIKRFMSQK